MAKNSALRSLSFACFVNCSRRCELDQHREHVEVNLSLAASVRPLHAHVHSQSHVYLKKSIAPTTCVRKCIELHLVLHRL